MLIGTKIGEATIQSGQAQSPVIDLGALVGAVFGAQARRIVALGIITPDVMTGTTLDVQTQDAAGTTDWPVVTGNPPGALVLAPLQAIIFTDYPFDKIRFLSDATEAADRTIELYVI